MSENAALPTSAPIASPKFDTPPNSSKGSIHSPMIRLGTPNKSIRMSENFKETVGGVITYEEPWTDDIEDLIKHWRSHAIKMSEMHENAAYYVKGKHNMFGLPPIILPLSMTFISQIIPEEHTSTIVNGAMFLLSGLSGAVYKWLNLGEKYALHFQYSARYDDIITAIDTELSRQKKFRRPADVFVTEIRCKIDNLNHTSPEFPMCCLESPAIFCCMAKEKQIDTAPQMFRGCNDESIV